MAVKNRSRSEWVLAQLEPRPGDRVLEIGFGPGVDIRRVSRAVRPGFVAGIDRSEVMLRQASGRNRDAIRAGAVELRQGDAARLPWPGGSFDKAFAINVAQFWSDPVQVLREVRRVLRPGGRLLIAVQPRDPGATEATARATADRLEAAVRAAGYGSVRAVLQPMKPVPLACVTGIVDPC